LKILVTFALDVEFAAWRKLRKFSKISKRAITTRAYEGRVGETDLRVILTGVGDVNARKSARAALEWMPDICISSGLAGSLRCSYRIGEVCAAREVVDLPTTRSLPADEELIQRANAVGAAIAQRMLTAAEMALSADGKSRLGRMGEIVEMESYAIMTEAAAAGVPAIAIRAVSDGADENLPLDFTATLDESGNICPEKVARAVLRAPQKIPALIRLAWNSHFAAKRLVRFLDAYVSTFSNAGVSHSFLAGASRT